MKIAKKKIKTRREVDRSPYAPGEKEMLQGVREKILARAKEKQAAAK